MKVLGFNIQKNTRSLLDWIDPIMGILKINTQSNYQASKALKLSTVYRAVNVIADSVAVLPIDVYKYKNNWKYKEYSKLYYLLNVQPNKLMSSFTMKRMIIQYMLLQGNAYILIKRDDKGNIFELQLLDSNRVSIKIVKNEVKYDYDGRHLFSADDIIHFLNYTENGLEGLSTISYASMTLSTSYSSEEHALKFFSGGGNMSGILRPTAGTTLNTDKAKKAKDSFVNQLSGELGGSSNSIIVLPDGLEYQAITVNPKDAQLLESRQFNIISIAQYFGVPPSKLFDLSKSSYSSQEHSQLDFLSSTIQPILEKIEIEIYRKVFTEVEYDTTELKFDVSNLLRLDATTQATYFSQLFQMGAITTNEIREKINMDYPATGGNRHFIQANLMPLDNPITDKNNVDNKIKTNE